MRRFQKKLIRFKKNDSILLTLDQLQSPGIFPGSPGYFSLRIAIYLRISLFRTSGARHGTTFGYVIALPATQGPATEVPARSRPPVVDGTTPLPDPAVVRRLFMQVPAGGIGKEKAVCFPQTAFTEVLQLVGLALPYKNNGEPAAALSAPAAGPGC